jgi:hypothetical protein
MASEQNGEHERLLPRPRIDFFAAAPDSQRAEDLNT